MKTRQMAVAVLLVLPLASAALAQEAPPAADDASTQTDKLRQLLDASVGWFEFSTGSDSREILKPRIALRWTNNTRSSADGLTVVWISSQGRPEAIAAVYPFDSFFCLEFDSLSRTTFKTTFHGQSFWSPEQAGMQFMEIEGAAPPVESKAARQLQMKQLARRFDAAMLGWSKKANQREQLRLLPRPIYRYEIEQPGEVLDGALFAFTAGTDPEAVVAIEAVRQGDQYRWMYAFVRQTSGALEARLGDQTVWQVPAYPDGSNPRGIHRGHRQPLDPLLAGQE